MKARRADITFAAIVLAIVVVLSLAQPQEAPPSTYSSYDTGPNGYRALYEVMRREGVSAGRFERALGTLRSFAGTLVLSPGEAQLVDGQLTGVVDSNDAARLKQLVQGGANLVMLGEGPFFPRRVLELPTTAPIPVASTAQAANNALTIGVTQVTASFSSAFTWSAKRRVERLLVAHGRPVAIAYRIGRGNVIAIAAPGVFSNDVLARAQNARFAYDVLSARGPLLFDESVHGYASGASMWDVLPTSVRDATWIMLCALALAVFGALFRSAPPITLAPPRLRDSSAYIASMAALLRRAHAGSAAIDRFAWEAQRLARLRPSAARRPEVAASLEQLEVMRRDPHPDNPELLDAANIVLHVRKELA